MTLNLLRWADRATAAAYYDLRDLAPQLSGLINSAAMPEAPLSVVLDWAEAVIAPEPGAAFTLERLGEVLPALVTAFLASHTYASEERREGGGDVIDLHDAGCGTVVGQVLPLTSRIAMALHGDEGRTLVQATQTDLTGSLCRIAEMIRGQ